jgi:hypothetical protein
MNLVQYWAQPTEVAPQPRPRQYSNTYMFIQNAYFDSIAPRSHVDWANINQVLAIT